MTDIPHSTNAIDDSSTHGVPPFRVQDNGRALWMVTLVLLLAGFAALRYLIGVADAPHIEPALGEGSPQMAPLIQPTTDEVHRLRPQTSTDLSGVHPLGKTPTWNETWPDMPAANWQIPHESLDTQLYRQPEFLR